MRNNVQFVIEDRKGISEEELNKGYMITISDAQRHKAKEYLEWLNMIFPSVIMAYDTANIITKRTGAKTDIIEVTKQVYSITAKELIERVEKLETPFEVATEIDNHFEPLVQGYLFEEEGKDLIDVVDDNTTFIFVYYNELEDSFKSLSHMFAEDVLLEAIEKTYNYLKENERSTGVFVSVLNEEKVIEAFYIK